MEIKLIESIKYLPNESKIIGLIVIVIGLIVIRFIRRKSKNSDNFKKAELSEDIEIEIGDKNLTNNIDKKNSNNFKKAKVGKNAKIKIGDGK